MPIEIAVTRRFRTSGWAAYWIPGIAQKSIRDRWREDLRYVNQLVKDRAVPPEIRRQVRLIRDATRDDRGRNLGWPDVVAWDTTGDRVRFAEIKRVREPMTAVQVRWWRLARQLRLVEQNDGVFLRWTVDRANKGLTRARAEPKSSG